MSKIDETIEELHFVVYNCDYSINSIEYLNTEDNRSVILQWDKDESECVIYCREHNQTFDDFGHPIDVSCGLDMVEMKVFMSKLEELRLMKYHVSVEVCANGKHDVAIIQDDDLANHIINHKKSAGGRGLFIDGICMNIGYLSGEQIRNWTYRLSKITLDEKTMTVSPIQMTDSRH